MTFSRQALAAGLLAAALAGLPWAAARSEGFQLELPVDCEMGPVCVVQHYVDMTPGPTAQDHTCGSLTYDRHNGIDFRTLTYAQMYEGVNVVAAAPGRVMAIRDSMPDRVISDQASDDAVKGRESGNFVSIRHGNGWATKYSHLKRGSLVVKPGDRVTTGQPLGQIGLSGRTQFPHLHFTLLRNGRSLDPFTGLAPASGCGEAKRSWWSKAALEALTYRPGGLLTSGFAGTVPAFPQFLESRVSPTVSPESPYMIAWLVGWGLRKDDRWTLKLTDPAGQVLVEKSGAMEKNRIIGYRYIGRKRPASGWPSGTYQVTVKMIRPEGPHAGVLGESTHRITFP